jgi:hypothetical protein
MADLPLFSEPSYSEELDAAPGEFHHLRLVMEQM